MEIVKSVSEQLNPFIDQWWHTAFQLGARGLTTGPMPLNGGALELAFDFVDHHVHVWTSGGRLKAIPLVPRTVAGFWRELKGVLSSMGIEVEPHPRSSEFNSDVPFAEDEAHASYDPLAVDRWWRAMTLISGCFRRHQSGFIGRASPGSVFLRVI